MKRKIFSCKQIAEIDQYTIQHEPITDIDLMERAASTIARWIIDNISTQHRIICFSGPGNNGGDALAIARLLTENNYHIELYQLDLGKALKGSPAINMKRLKEQGKVKISRLKQGDSLPLLSDNDVILDGMFGSGLVRPLEGLPATIAHHINALGATVIAIDIPSGLFGEDNTQNTPETIVKADVTLTFQFPKLSFFLPGPGEFAGNWIVLSIGLHPKIIEDTDTPFSFIEKDFIAQKLKKRPKFSHKGSYGHALLIAGSYGKMGAAVLAAHACLRAGTGLLTTHVPHMGYQIIQNTVPESMVSIDRSDIIFTEFPDLAQYSAVGIGPGLDTKANSLKALEELLHQCKIPLVIDADGLNLLSKKLALLSKLPPNTILTPHPKEFDRLAGHCENAYERLQRQRQLAQDKNIIVILKGAHTSIALPDGNCFFNTTGNPGMATAGSGDVLTGIILSLLSQGYSPCDATLVGVYLHGLAGDMAKNQSGEEALIARDIIATIGPAFNQLKKS